MTDESPGIAVPESVVRWALDSDVKRTWPSEPEEEY